MFGPWNDVARIDAEGGIQGRAWGEMTIKSNLNRGGSGRPEFSLLLLKSFKPSTAVDLVRLSRYPSFWQVCISH